MNKRQKKKMAKKMREGKKPVGVGTAAKMLCDAKGVFNAAMAAYAGETKTFTEILTRQRATGRRKKRIAASGRHR
nr:MAG TPA: hypothetical protein [Caudoviricetes sp.]